jgi:uncharacterized membrane protein
MSKKTSWLWLLALAAVVGYFFLTYGELPGRVATHFDGAGRPNGFQTKQVYLTSFLGFIFILNGIFGGLYFLLRRIPAAFLNIPRKDYWLSTPELRDELRQKLQGLVGLLGLFLNTVFLFTERVIYQQNTSDAVFEIPLMGGVIFILVCSLFFVLFIFVLLKPRDKPPA